MIELPSDLPAEVVPFAWLLGVWEGTGVVEYTADGHRYTGEFTHRVSFSHDGGSFVNYSATAVFAPEEGEQQKLNAEVGFWRLARPRTNGDVGPALLPAAEPASQTTESVEELRQEDGGFQIEVTLVQSDGVAEVYLGSINGPRVNVETDAVVRPPSAAEYVRGSRMYGLVQEHLLWAWDIQALGGEFGSHASARLAKVE